MLYSGSGSECATAIYLAPTQLKLHQGFVGVFGWSPNEYEMWLAETLKQQLLPRITDLPGLNFRS
jgi:hypothetical protein